MISKLTKLILIFGIASQLMAEAPSAATSAPKLAILPTTDTTQWGLAEALQYSLGKLAVGTRLFNVGSSTFVLEAFTRRELRKAFASNRSPLLMFTYIEPGRVSVFFFNAYQFGKFIVGSKSLTPPDGQKISSRFIETQFKAAFDETIELFHQNKYQALPESEADDDSDFNGGDLLLSETRNTRIKEIFNEVSRLEDKPFYVGANIGIARYTLTATSSSSPLFGVSIGGRFTSRIAASLGIDLFSHLFAHGDVFYKIPFAEKYISLSAIGTVGSTIATLTENRGYGTENKGLGTESMKAGSIFMGPGLAIDIPLLGATLRGEIRYYFGSSSVLVGNYGLLFSI